MYARMSQTKTFAAARRSPARSAKDERAQSASVAGLATTEPHRHLAELAPTLSEPPVVTEPLEHRDQPLGLRTSALRVGRRIGLQTQERQRQTRPRLGQLVGRPLARSRSPRCRPRSARAKLARLGQRPGEIRLRVQAIGVVHGQKRRSPARAGLPPRPGLRGRQPARRPAASSRSPARRPSATPSSPSGPSSVRYR